MNDNPSFTTLATGLVSHTPHGVWLTLGVLVLLGLRQLRSHRISRTRALLMPLAMAALSLVSTASAFGASLAVACAWLAAGGAAFLVGRGFAWTRPVGYDDTRDVFEMAGSAWPLALLLGIFMLRYTVGASLAMHAGWAASPAFALAASALYGAMTGLFSVRAFNLLQFVRAAARMQPQ